jgi:sorting nexin-25
VLYYVSSAGCVSSFKSDQDIQAGHAKEDWINGEKTEVVVSFLDRLYTAKRKVDERIAVLGGGEGDAVSSSIS